MLRPLLSVLMLLLLGGPTFAGVADTPLPTLGGEKSKHLFSVPGVIKGTDLSTSFTCSSLEESEQFIWAVQVFDSSGLLVGTQSLVIAPGGVQSMVLGGSTLFELVIPGPADSGSPLSARVVATSNKLTCTALVLSDASNGSFTLTGFELPVIKKTSQKGD